MTGRPIHASFVCSGNICRSPYAEEALRRRAAERGWGDRLRVSSAGTFGFRDQRAHPLVIAIAGEHGLDLSAHRSRAIHDEYLESCDVVLCMGREHARMLRKVFPAHAERVYLLGSYPHHHLRGEEIPDPISEEEPAFRSVLAAIDRALEPVVAELERLLAPPPGASPDARPGVVA